MVHEKATRRDEKQSKDDVFLGEMKEGAGGSGVRGWAREMRSAFGGPFLCLVSLVYFTQGFRSFVWTAVSYQMKNRLSLSPSSSQFVVSIAYFPWSIKPLYGIISDCIPIRGKKRVPYLGIATILSLFPWIILGIIASSRNSWNSLTILLTVQNIGSAMADVIDAMIAEAIHSEQAQLSGDLQSLSWSSMALGGILGSLLGGYALSSLRIEKIFLLFSILPVFQLLSCSFVKEVPSGVHKKLDRSSNHILELDAVSSKELSSREKLNGGTTRRRKSKDDSDKRKMDILNSESERLQNTAPSRLLESLRSAFYGLCQAFTQPIILRPMAWFFLSHIMIPNLSTVTFYYQTDFLNLEASFLGNARVIGWLGLMLGTYCYNRYLKRMRLRRILLWSHIGLGIINLLDIALVSRLNFHLGIPDKYMVLFGSALRDAVIQFKMMPFLIISGRLCPPGIEGTLFALFMSINNLGSNLSSFLGASVASILNISSGSFDNLLYGLLVQQLATFLPIAFLFLIPSDATG